MIKPTVLCITVLFASAAHAQSVEPDRAPLRLIAPVEDKDFFLLATLERTAEAKRAVEHDPALSRLAGEKRAALAKAAKSCETSIPCYASAIKWSAAEIDGAADALRALYRGSPGVRGLVDGPLRRSGVFIHEQSRSGEQLLADAWLETAENINRIIDVYALGVAPRYPEIDAPSYDVKSDTYGHLVQIIAAVLDDQRDDLALFFQPSLRFALELLSANRRDEAGRFEPLDAGENRAAIRRASTIRWRDFPYSVIVVPGAGGDRESVVLSPWGKLRLEIAVRRFHEGKAPFLLVSGGFVHPNQTPHCEAIEMKKALMTDFGIPEDAILIDPHARHTTTNLRNAARELYRYGLPFSKPGLISTDPNQSTYIESPVFHKRCLDELGYEPAVDLRRVSQFDLTFLPNIDALQLDARDPLDP